jgi:sulfane dehydrogenase subunit SoxC
MSRAAATPPPCPALGPLAAPTATDALGRERMTLDEHFRRDHFDTPEVDVAAWCLEVGGVVRRSLRLALADLEAGSTSELVVLECAGHRRAEQVPTADGVPWGTGAVGELLWTGVPLAALLGRAGVIRGATAVVLEGGDRGPVPGGHEEPYAKALPLAKAMASESLVAVAAAGAPIPVRRGGPVRAIIPGWYATDSVKWLQRITVVDAPFAGHFEAGDYRLAPVGSDAPGERLADLRVHALVTSPGDGARLDAGEHDLRGIAWGGAGGIDAVRIRIDGGPWRPAELGPDRGRFARRFWTARWHATQGVHHIEVRARDRGGQMQPLEHVPNRDGYANHSVPRVRVVVA